MVNFQFVIEYIVNNPLESAGVLLSLFYIWFSVQAKVVLWFFGFFSGVCLSLFYYQQKIYANALLQVYYIGISAYGLWLWLHKKTDNSEFDISKIKRKHLILALAVSMFCFVALYFILKKFTNTQVPVIDAFTTALCIVGTYFLAHKVLENWLFFILADLTLLWLSMMQKWYLLAVLYAVYSTMGVWGFFKWRKTLKNKQIECL